MSRVCFLYILFVLELAAAPFAWGEAIATDSSSPLLTLDEAVSIASEHNRDVRVKSLEVTKAGEKVAQTRTKYLPKLDTYVMAGYLLQPLEFTIPAGTLGNYQGTGPIPDKDSTIRSNQFSALVYLSAAQPLTQLYKVNLADKQAQLGTELFKQSVRAEQHEIRLKVKDAYYRAVQLQAQVEGAKADVQYLTELSKLTDRRLSAQTVLASDSLTVKAKLKQQRYQLLTLQDAFELQKQSLNNLLGRALRTQFSVEIQPQADGAELDMERARKQALESRPELSEARLQTKIAHMDVQRERAEYIPDISLQLSYLSFPNVKFMPQNIWNIGLLFQWQPFDWGYKKHRIAEFRAATEQKKVMEQDAEQRVLLDVEDKFRKAGQARMLLEAQTDAREAERVKLREVTDRYTQKAALLPDVLRQQAALSQAESQYQQALAGFWTSRAEFEKAIGAE